MKLFFAFLKLIRWNNLFIISLTQYLFFFCLSHSIILPTSIFSISQIAALKNSAYLIMTSSVLIAAGGFIINDYFDVHIDSINKPGKNIIDKLVKRRWAIVWHLLFSFTGLLISGYVSLLYHNWWLIVGNTFSVMLLWLYSTTFKKKLLIGNIIIAALSSWVIVVMYLFMLSPINMIHLFDVPGFQIKTKILLKWTILYSGFAFIVTIIREVVKDMEDRIGDATFNCETIPIKWGVAASKIFIGVWIFFCIALLMIAQIFIWQNGWHISAIYSSIFILIPLLFSFSKLYNYKTTEDYHQLSTLIKLIMLAGILSMIFFNFLP